MKGILVTFEGIDRSGKQTQIDLLAEHLGDRATVGREPGGTAYGEAARRLVQDPRFIERVNKGYAGVDGVPQLDSQEGLEDTAELFGYLIARSMFIKRLVGPALENGKIFIADRLGDSSVAYQGYGNARGDQETIRFIRMCNEYCYGDVSIDRTYLIDITVEESLSRKGDGEFGGQKDRIEQREKDYFEKVRQGYLEMAKQEPERFLVINGSLPVDEIASIIKGDIDEILSSS